MEEENKWTEDGLPVVSLDTLLTHRRDLTGPDSEVLYLRWLEEMREENPVLYTHVGAASEVLEGEARSYMLGCLLDMYQIMKSQAQANQLGEQIEGE